MFLEIKLSCSTCGKKRGSQTYVKIWHTVPLQKMYHPPIWFACSFLTKRWPVVWIEFVYWITLCFLEFKWTECLFCARKQGWKMKSGPERGGVPSDAPPSPPQATFPPYALLRHALGWPTLHSWLKACFSGRLALPTSVSHGSLPVRFSKAFVIWRTTEFTCCVVSLLPQVDCKPREGRGLSIIPTGL